MWRKTLGDSNDASRRDAAPEVIQSLTKLPPHPANNMGIALSLPFLGGLSSIATSLVSGIVFFMVSND